MKKIILSIIGGFIVLLLVAFNYYTRQYFNNNDKIIKNLNLLKQKELKLNYEIFTISVYLYKNFDSIVILENQIDKILDNLTNNKEFKSKPNSYKDFLKYKKDIKNKINQIYSLETIIAPLKNADMYVAELITKLPQESMNKKYKNVWINIASNVFLAKSSLDTTFIKTLQKNISKLEEAKDNKYNNIFIKNVKLINDLFPIYVTKMDKILHSNTQLELEKCFTDFLIETNQKLRIITIVSALLILFVIASIILIVVLFTILEKENKILEKMSITDELTSLYNRRKLQMDITKDKVLIIVNIDRFKYYNDLYGIDVGDFVLKSVANSLKNILSSNVYKPVLYRLGGDDFGILYNKVTDKYLIKISMKIIEYFNNHAIKYNGIEFHIGVSIGISYISPLIETADISLKLAKKDKKQNIKIYNPALQEKKKIAENMKKISDLKNAIKNDKIIPYYQPIFSNKTGKIIKYEVLARIIDGDKVMSIYPFLNVAKENRDYKYITQMIYMKAFEKFKDKQIEFSLNISIDDINNQETMRFIYNLMDTKREMFKYITFEILEDDAIHDYKKLKEFIQLVKKYGSKIAIDDFGSGYSNFAHILNLDIDYLKIDGSLIKNIDRDKKMRLIVETIMDFTKKTNIETIAEFVYNEKVLKEVKALNIDYSQGFYLGEPKEDLVKVIDGN